MDEVTKLDLEISKLRISSDNAQKELDEINNKLFQLTCKRERIIADRTYPKEYFDMTWDFTV